VGKRLGDGRRENSAQKVREAGGCYEPKSGVAEKGQECVPTS